MKIWKSAAALLMAAALSCTAARAEFDLAGMSDAELEALQSAVAAELAGRRAAAAPEFALLEEVPYLDSTDDFLSDAARVAYVQDCYNSARFRELYIYMLSYEAAVAPPETDRLYDLLAVIEPCSDALAGLEEDADAFDSSAHAFHWAGVDAIGDGCCLFPYFSSADWFALKIGFIADDWLFFDRIAVSVDGEVVDESSLKDTVQEILPDGDVMEYAQRSIDFFDREQIAAMTGDGEVILRFYAKDGDKHLDHALTPEEKAALDAMTRLMYLRGQLSSALRELQK